MCHCAEDFLKECYLLIQSRSIHFLSKKKKNKDTLNLLGYNIAVMLQEIIELTEGDLHEGPVPDDNINYPGNVWIFKKNISGYPIYIKLKFKLIEGVKLLLIMSFHLDE